MAPVLKLVCQPNYQDGCALAGLIDQCSPGGIGSDRPSEKRKVGSSTLPLTTSSEALSGIGSRSGEPNGEPRKELRSPHDGQHSAPSRSRRGRDLLRRGEEPLRRGDLGRLRARAGSGSGARSPAGPRRRSGTSSRRRTPSLTAACIPRPRTRSGMRWTTGWRAACRAGRNGRGPSTVRRSSRCWSTSALRPLRELTARDVRRGLEALSEQMSTRYLQLARAVPGAGDPVCRGARPGRPERGDSGRQPEGPDRAAEPLVYLGAVPRAAGGGPGVPAERLRRAEPRGRHPHRGGPGTALGSRRPGRRSERGAARAAVGGGLAFGTAGRRHQDGQVAADAGAAPSGRSGSPGAPQAAGRGPAGGRMLCGRITAWSSPRPSARRWTRRTSAASSARSPRRLASAQTGRRGTCATPSSP